MFQDYVTYQATAKENIGLGSLPELEDEHAVAVAAQRGGAEELVKGLPHEWETMLGKWFDEGVNLSGGEWQKVALSRAFMRDVRILVLDEPDLSPGRAGGVRALRAPAVADPGADGGLHLAPLLDGAAGGPDPVLRARRVGGGWDP